MSNCTTLTEKYPKVGVLYVEKAIPQFIRCLLLRLREADLSYGEIGSRINTERSTVKKIIDGTWYPKTRRAQNILLSNVFKIKISDFELKEGIKGGMSYGDGTN